MSTSASQLSLLQLIKPFLLLEKLKSWIRSENMDSHIVSRISFVSSFLSKPVFFLLISGTDSIVSCSSLPE